MAIKFHSISSQNQRNVKFICITVQDELISSLCSLLGSKFQVTSRYVMWKYLFTSYLLQCSQALVHSQSISQSRGSRSSNIILFKTVEE